MGYSVQVYSATNGKLIENSIAQGGDANGYVIGLYPDLQTNRRLYANAHRINLNLRQTHAVSHVVESIIDSVRRGLVILVYASCYTALMHSSVCFLS